MIVTVEGADGTGKTEVGKLLAHVLGDVELIHFPDDDAVTGRLIRSYLKRHWFMVDHMDERVDQKDEALAFQSLQVTNRMERMVEIEPCAVNIDNHIVLVRYWQSAWVYGQLDGLDPEWLEDVHGAMPESDLNILLDIDRDTVEKRRTSRDGDDTPERYEIRGEFTHRVINLYRDLWERKMREEEGAWVIVDSRMLLHTVVAHCLGHVFKINNAILES